MRCPIETQETAELLLAYSARKLDPESAAGLERHMRVCPSCRAFAEGQRLVWEALDAWDAVPVSPDFDRRLYARIDREVSWWERTMRPFRPVLMRSGLPVAAAACLLVMAGMVLERPGAVPSIPSGSPSQVEAVQADQVENALEDIELLREFNLAVGADASRTSM
jgi:hypothetical protein